MTWRAEAVTPGLRGAAEVALMGGPPSLMGTGSAQTVDGAQASVKNTPSPYRRWYSVGIQQFMASPVWRSLVWRSPPGWQTADCEDNSCAVASLRGCGRVALAAA